MRPKVIETEAEFRQASEALENLTFADRELSPAELALRELLKKLVVDYDERTHPLPNIEPRRLLKGLLEQRELKQRDLIPVLGGGSTIRGYPFRQTHDQQDASQEACGILSCISRVFHLRAGIGGFTAKGSSDLVFVRADIVDLENPARDRLRVSIAHEMRHVWQNLNWNSTDLADGPACERDALQYQTDAIGRYIDLHSPPPED